MSTSRSTIRLLIVAIVVLAVTVPIATRRQVPRWELDLTEWINAGPAWVADVLWPVMQLGTVWAPVLIGAGSAFAWGNRRGLIVGLSGVAAWFLAKLVKAAVERQRPLAYLSEITVREGSGEGLGYVSGHTAVAFAVATAVRPVLPRWAAIVAYVAASLVGLARVVHGVHLVVDVVGGAALGVATACAVELLATPTPRSASSR